MIKSDSIFLTTEGNIFSSATFRSASGLILMMNKKKAQDHKQSHKDSSSMPTEWTVERHLERKPDAIVALYRRFIALVEECGPFTYSVSKTAITLKGTRRGFAGLKPKDRFLDGYLDLQRQVRDRRVRSVSAYTKRLFVHQFRVTMLDELDDEFAGWIREAYAVGAGAHLEG